MKNDELTVRTPLGELVVGIKADPDYPGISVAFRILSGEASSSGHCLW